MKRMIIYYAGAILTMLMFKGVRAQDLVVNAFIPPGALIEKEQLWNVIISNPTSTPRSCQISLTVLNKANGNKMLSAVTNNIIVPAGTRQIQVADVMPVIYNALNENVNLTGQGILPVGLYQVCYELVSKGVANGSSCIDVQVDALAPPQLIFPENKSELHELQPAFSWIPPAPMTMVRNCTYAYTLVKVNANQTAADAINDNAPVYRTFRLTNTALTYPASSPALEKQQLYAWQIIAQTSTANIKSDVWTFSIIDSEQVKLQPGAGTAYTKLAKKNERVSYSIVSKTLRFSWYNEGLDSLFQIRILDVTGGNHIPLKIKEEAIYKFSPGINLINMNLQEVGKFIQNHLYEFTLTDKQGQEWKMFFEYTEKRNRRL